MRIRSSQDLLAGMVFLVIAGIAWMSLRQLPLGSALRMGPGYFPTLVCGIISGFGLLVLARAFVLTGPPLTPAAWRPIIALAGSVAAFALAIDRLGLVLSTIILVLIVRLATRDQRPAETGLLGAALAVMVTVIFSVVLGLAIPIWPWPT